MLEGIIAKQAETLDKITSLLDRVLKLEQIEVIEERLAHLRDAEEYAPGGAKYEQGKAQWDSRPKA